MIKAITLAAALLAADAAPEPPHCGPLDTVRAQLRQEFGELPLWRGVGEGPLQVEITANPSGSTWTMMVVLPSGAACLWKEGTGWSTPAAAPPPERDPT